MLILKNVLVLQFFHSFTENHTDGEGECTPSYANLSPRTSKLRLLRTMYTSQEADKEKNIQLDNKTLSLTSELQQLQGLDS